MDLGAVELRVLGCLIEKQRTTPDVYPLSVNSLRSACNQSTNRDPVVSYDEPTIRAALNELSRRGWVRLASGPGSRAAKYRHLLNDALRLSDAEISLLAVLMLRGPQTPGELKQRSDRLHPVASLDEVDRTVNELIERGWSTACRAGRARRRSGTPTGSARTRRMWKLPRPRPRYPPLRGWRSESPGSRPRCGSSAGGWTHSEGDLSAEAAARGLPRVPGGGRERRSGQSVVQGPGQDLRHATPDGGPPIALGQGPRRRAADARGRAAGPFLPAAVRGPPRLGRPLARRGDRLGRARRPGRRELPHDRPEAPLGPNRLRSTPKGRRVRSRLLREARWCVSRR